MRHTIEQFDIHVARLVAKLPDSLHTPFVWLGRFTTPALWASYLVVLEFFLLHPDTFARSTMVVILFMPLASVMKLFIRRTRPLTIYTQSMKIKSYSFPSSHAYSAMLSCVYIASVLGPLVGIVAIVMATVIGISRVFVGAHYPSDVSAAWLLGLVVAGLILASI